jgi:hypothetical protein
MIPESKVAEVLDHPEDYTWTLQGFGMLRTYLDPDEKARLHIWDLDSAVPDVSTMHNHPWDFTSQLYYGGLVNYRYDITKANPNHHCYPTHLASPIRTGEGGFIHGKPYLVTASLTETETLWPGDSYHQEAEEFHESMPMPGTVTVIEREFTKVRDQAVTCWAKNGKWVSAEPRPATEAEVRHFLDKVSEVSAL